MSKSESRGLLFHKHAAPMGLNERCYRFLPTCRPYGACLLRQECQDYGFSFLPQIRYNQHIYKSVNYFEPHMKDTKLVIEK